MSPSPISVHAFFNEVVPQALRRVAVPREAARTLVVRLFGTEPGEWTVDLGRRRVARGGVRRPDLYLEMDGADFAALLRDALDLEAAVRAGRVRFAGDLRLLEAFGHLLAALPAFQPAPRRSLDQGE